MVSEIRHRFLRHSVVCACVHVDMYIYKCGCEHYEFELQNISLLQVWGALEQPQSSLPSTNPVISLRY